MEFRMLDTPSFDEPAAPAAPATKLDRRGGYDERAIARACIRRWDDVVKHWLFDWKGKPTADVRRLNPSNRRSIIISAAVMASLILRPGWSNSADHTPSRMAAKSSAHWFAVGTARGAIVWSTSWFTLAGAATGAQPANFAAILSRK
jgi:hypothetical protein